MKYLSLALAALALGLAAWGALTSGMPDCDAEWEEWQRARLTVEREMDVRRQSQFSYMADGMGRVIAGESAPNARVLVSYEAAKRALQPRTDAEMALGSVFSRCNRRYMAVGRDST